MDHLILVRRPGLVLKKENLLKSGLCYSIWPLDKTEGRQKERLKLDLASELKKTMELESVVDTNCNWCAWYSHQRTSTGTGGLGNKRTSGDNPNYSIVEISQNTEKSPGDLNRLAVTQTSVENQLILVWKTLKRMK